MFSLFAILFFFCVNCSGSTFNNAFAPNNRGYRAKETFHIHPKAHVLDIVTIQLRFHINLLFVPAVDLRPSRQTGTNVVCSVFITFFDQVKLVPEGGPRSYNRHIPDKNIKELRQFIQ